MIDTRILEKELARCINSLAEYNPGTEQYRGVLNSIAELRFMIADLKEKQFKERQSAFVITPAPAQLYTGPQQSEPTDDEDEAPTGEKNDEAPEEPTKEEEPETPTYKKEEVRAALGKARAEKGLNVVGYLKTNYGVDNFTALPAGKYAEVMADLEKMGKT